MIKIFEDIKNIDKTLLFNRSLSASGVEDIVSDIIANVRSRGDEALFEYTERFDRAKLTSLEVSKLRYVKTPLGIDRLEAAIKKLTN